MSEVEGEVKDLSKSDIIRRLEKNIAKARRLLKEGKGDSRRLERLIEETQLDIIQEKGKRGKRKR